MSTSSVASTSGAIPDELPIAALLNGQVVRLESSGEDAVIPALDARRLVLDRGLHFGDGLFETIACVGGAPRFLDDHLERLGRGCDRLKLAAPPPELRGEIERLARGAGAALVKVLYTRGPATARGYAPRGDERPTRIVMRYEWPPEDPRHAAEGVAVQIAALTLGENPRLAGLKHLNRLELVLARAELAGAGLEALLLTGSGQLISGTMSNLFLVHGGRLETPRLDRCGVAGVMRRVVMRAAAEAGLAVEEMRLTQADLDTAQEVFLTNARIGIWPVRAVQSRVLVPGSVTRRLQRLIQPLLEHR
ncbi:MAG TPA: aminodeoxychorismate lyase [Steroidobacteraceae bacterium]|nr:aminodeoxychorismate lyase [Steroidobacteraceae bacterium]